METIMQDVRHGFRTLIKSPLFAIVAILALALGIGVNTAIFSVINVMLMRPLPFAEPDQLMAIWTTNATRNTNRSTTAPPDYRAWKENKAFDQVGAYFLGDFNITATDQAERVRGATVTTNLFPLLHVTPRLGRLFTQQEEEFGQHRQAASVTAGLPADADGSLACWRNRFHALNPNAAAMSMPAPNTAVLPKPVTNLYTHANVRSPPR